MFNIMWKLLLHEQLLPEVGTAVGCMIQTYTSFYHAPVNLLIYSIMKNSQYIPRNKYQNLASWNTVTNWLERHMNKHRAEGNTGTY